MVRNNEERFGPRNTGGDETPVTAPESLLQFVTPTEFVEIPSRGIGYPVGHPLCGKETIEIRYMTAKDEDILTSRSLIKKGIALERLISNLIVDKTIMPSTMLSGDRNAIVIAARASAYGHLYKTTVTCPSCQAKQKYAFDLADPDVYHGDETNEYNIKTLDNGNYLITLPVSNFEVEVKLLRGEDEAKAVKIINDKKTENSLISNQMKLFIVSVNGHNQPGVIQYFIENAPSSQTRMLREAYDLVTPNVKIKGDFECEKCNHEEAMEVSLGADFFWPDR